jgi:hypothetical protein
MYRCCLSASGAELHSKGFDAYAHHCTLCFCFMPRYPTPKSCRAVNSTLFCPLGGFPGEPFNGPVSLSNCHEFSGPRLENHYPYVTLCAHFDTPLTSLAISISHAAGLS